MGTHWRKARGFTLVELIIAISWFCSLGLGIYITYLIIMALKKYIGS